MSECMVCSDYSCEQCRLETRCQHCAELEAEMTARIAQLTGELADARREKHMWVTKAGELRRDYEMAWKRGDDAKRELNAIAARVTLWRELESILRDHGHVAAVDNLLSQLAALDAKEGKDGE